MEINVSLYLVSAFLMDRQNPLESGNNGNPGASFSSKN